MLDGEDGAALSVGAVYLNESIREGFLDEA